jgi:CRP-like cAMP-binding protein
MRTSTTVRVSDPPLADLAASRGEEAEFPRCHVVFTQGEPGDRIHIIQTGKVKISRNAPHGGRANVLAVHGSADMFGLPDARECTSLPAGVR